MSKAEVVPEGPSVGYVDARLAKTSCDSVVGTSSRPDDLFEAATGMIPEASEEANLRAEEEVVDYGDSGDDRSWESPHPPSQNPCKFDGFSAEALRAISSLEGETPAREGGSLVLYLSHC